MTPRSVICLLCLSLAGGCADTPLPDLTLPAGQDTRVGIDLGAEKPIFGVHVTDPFDQRSP